jgi:hypothetical protein
MMKPLVFQRGCFFLLYLYNNTSIITTHSNINTSDIFIIFNNITFNLQEHSAINFKFHSFSKKFIVPLN